MKKLTLSLAIAVGALFGNAALHAAGPITWAQSYGAPAYWNTGQHAQNQFYGSGDDYPVGIAKMPDGGVVVAGQIAFPMNYLDANYGTTDAVLARFGADGTLIWQRDLHIDFTKGSAPHYSRSASYVYQVATDAQGNIFVCGGKGNPDNSGQLPFVAKLSPAGSLIWQNGIQGAATKEGNPPQTTVYGVTQFQTMSLTPDGGVLVGASQGMANNTQTRPIMAKFNNDGALGMYAAFNFTQAVTGKDGYAAQYIGASAVGVSKDGSKYVMLLQYPQSGSFAPNPHGMTAIVCDTAGNIIGQRAFAPDDGRLETPISIIGTADGGFATLSWLYNNTYADGGMVVRKTNADLSVATFEKVIRTTSASSAVSANSLAEMPDGTLVIGGHKNAAEAYSGDPNGFEDAMIMKLKADGSLDFVSLIGGPRQDGGPSKQYAPETGAYVVPMADGGFALAVGTASYGIDYNLNYTNWWIVKTDANRKVRGFTDFMLDKPLAVFKVTDTTRPPDTTGYFFRISTDAVAAVVNNLPAFNVLDPSTFSAPNAPENIFQASVPRIAGSRRAEAVVGQHFSYQVLSLFFDPAKSLTYSATGLPSNFAIDPKTGVISGVAKAGTETSTPINVTVQVTDGTDTATAVLALTISDGVPVLTVNGATTPTSGLADTVLRFAAQYPGSIAGRVVSVQATTDPNKSTGWTNLATGMGGYMTPDFSSGQYVLNTTSYPAQDGVSFRVRVTASGHTDVFSQPVGPFNLASTKGRAGQPVLRIVRNGLRADLDFRAQLVSQGAPGISVRVQSTATPSNEASWSDLVTTYGALPPMTASDATHYSLATNDAPRGDGIYFRAIASASGYVDSISNVLPAKSLAPVRPPQVTVNSPSSSTDVANPTQVRQAADGTYTYTVNVTPTKGDRDIATLSIAFDGEIISTFDKVTSGQLYTVTRTTTLLGDHVIEAIAVDNLGVVGRAASGAQYLRILPPVPTSNSSTAKAATFRREIYTVANSGGDWNDPATWRNATGNPGVPSSVDFVILGNSTVKNVAGSVYAMTVSGGHLSGGQLQVGNMLTVSSGTFDGSFVLTIKPGAVCELLNATDIVVDGVFQNQGTVNLHGARGLKGVSNFVNIGKITFQSVLLPSEQVAQGLPLDPRAVEAGNLDLSGKVGQSFFGPAGTLISPNGAALIAPNGAALISPNGGTLISEDAGSLISQDGGSLISQDGGSLISEDAGSLISQDGGSLISQDGGSLLSEGGLGIISPNGGTLKVKPGASQTAPGMRAATATSGITISGGECDLTGLSLIGPVTINGGLLSGSGVIAGSLTNSGGYISPGHSPGGITVTGNFTQGANGTTVIEAAGGAAGQFDRLLVAGTATLGGKLDMRLLNGYVPLEGETFNPLSYSSATGSFSSSSNAGVTTTANGLLVTINPNAAQPSPARLLNISTRLSVQTGENVLISGFIVTGPVGSTKKIMIRGLGPSLANQGVPNTLSDPLLELHKGDGSLVTSNDDWQQGDTGQIPTGFGPSNAKESVIVATLSVGSGGYSSYTAVMKGAHDEKGVGLAEVYDLEGSSQAQLANISTRGIVQTGDDVMIGGVIVGGGDPSKVLVRAIGPSLKAAGVNGALEDTTLELHDAQGSTVANDDWRASQEKEVTATTIPPVSERESAIVQTLVPGNYTAIVRGKNGATGVGLVEAYNLQ